MGVAARLPQSPAVIALRAQIGELLPKDVRSFVVGRIRSRLYNSLNGLEHAASETR